MKKLALILGTLFLLIIVWAIYYAFSTGPNFPQVPKSKIPPPVVITLSRSNAPFQAVSGAGGVTFVLPDGTLWRWGMRYGASLQLRALVPEQLGTNRNWVHLGGLGGGRFAALRTDNTLWELKTGATPGFDEFLQQVDPHPEWTSVVANGFYALALKKDGSLWTWGNSSSTQPSLPPSLCGTNLIQIGTNKDWEALSTSFSATAYLLKKDHTLWVWGQTYDNSTRSVTFHSTPVQFSSDTNWVSVIPAFSPFLRNSLGEVYYFNLAAPENAPVARRCPPFVTNIFSDQMAVAYTGKLNLFTIHADGTMWVTTLQLIKNGIKINQKWQRFGTRSDWVSIWNGGGTALALTQDGTLWMWGQDKGQEPIPDNRSKLTQLTTLILTKLGHPPYGTTISAALPIQTEPRPLLRLVYSNTNQITAGK